MRERIQPFGYLTARLNNDGSTCQVASHDYLSPGSFVESTIGDVDTYSSDIVLAHLNLTGMNRRTYIRY
jgi:hypothetical protein